ncbi:hypothetical protein SCHPADRAFT_994449 [Schizopora paradoxa]|uniref:Uncharacterized protein n=1 Tax=Schizopora paradoxa TaxID=27342 RepID=A0A0H2RYU3_9AGAM|nr:hypothetical protein SCHPADRAFT_994449 [Schizopora paradoxa]
MTMATSDRGYLNLLQHLRKRESTLSKDTLHGAISHYLVHLPPANPIPTPLVAFVVTSHLWRPFDLTQLLSLASAFRSAVHLKHEILEKESRGLFGGTLSGHLSEWTLNVLSGLENGDSIMKMAVCGGVLMGLNDLQSKVVVRSRCKVEESLVLNFSEVLEDASAQPINSDGAWENEFLPRTEDSHKRLNIAVLLASHHFPFVTDSVVSAVRLPIIIGLCLSTLESAFKAGRFLAEATSSAGSNESGSRFDESSRVTKGIEELTTSVNFLNVAPITKLLARSIVLYADNAPRSKRASVWDAISQVSDALGTMSGAVERDWRSSPLQNINSDADLDVPSPRTTEKIWLILKTLLFSIVMVEQAVLDVMLYLPSISSQRSANGKQRGSSRSAQGIASSLLYTLMHLSFVVAEFGGVTAPTSTGNEPTGGFPELRKVFYMALDLLSTDQQCSMDFIDTIFDEVHFVQALVQNNTLARSKTTLALACIEQLVPVVNEECVERHILPLCEPHLWNPGIRETYESSHSVMLAIFAAHARNSLSSTLDTHSSFYHRLVPGYAKALIQNAEEGKLTTAQFRLAYSALVRSAGSASKGTHSLDEDSLAWLCISILLEAIETRRAHQGTEELERLHLTLISLTSNISVTLLGRILDEVGKVIEGEKVPRRKKILIDALYEELVEKFGDMEKEAALKWWYKNIRHWDVMGLEDHV